MSQRLIEEFRATFPGHLGPGAVPPGLHWALAPDLAEPQALGRDGHPRPGLFLPALPLPRRMWAGGELVFHTPLAPGDLVTCDSTLTDITFKEGSSGRLGFVTLHHRLHVAGDLRIEERQDIVYRGDPTPGTPPAALPKAEAWQTAAAWELTPDPVLLFRYSALTFNGHRIHYDLPYATGVEGYGGLVVHGPMQALLMLNLVTEILGRLPARLRYRGVSPLICGLPVRIEAQKAEDEIALRVRTAEGVLTMQATATP